MICLSDALLPLFLLEDEEDASLSFPLLPTALNVLNIVKMRGDGKAIDGERWRDGEVGGRVDFL
jgi:hypothetical protein